VRRRRFVRARSSPQVIGLPRNASASQSSRTGITVLRRYAEQQPEQQSTARKVDSAALRIRKERK
jgi:hypothetical protein